MKVSKIHRKQHSPNHIYSYFMIIPRTQTQERMQKKMSAHHFHHRLDERREKRCYCGQMPYTIFIFLHRRSLRSWQGHTRGQSPVSPKCKSLAGYTPFSLSSSLHPSLFPSLSLSLSLAHHFQRPGLSIREISADCVLLPQPLPSGAGHRNCVPTSQE